MCFGCKQSVAKFNVLIANEPAGEQLSRFVNSLTYKACQVNVGTSEKWKVESAKWKVESPAKKGNFVLPENELLKHM